MVLFPILAILLLLLLLLLHLLLYKLAIVVFAKCGESVQKVQYLRDVRCESEQGGKEELCICFYVDLWS